MTSISYQLYSSRKDPDPAGVLPALAALGYERVEGYGGLFEDEARLARLKADLEKTGLAMPTAHFGIEMVEKEPGRVVQIARTLGIETVYCPYLTADQRPTSGAGYVAFGRRLQAASAPLRDAGLGFGWHNHDFELETLADGAVPLAAIFEGGPDLEWEADIAWIIRGGGDPFHWLRTLGSRLTAVHLKDIAPEGENADEDGWADLGQGTVDWPALMVAIRRTPARWLVLEHDNPSDPARFARRSLAAARQL
jgi:sugar phosphate isomerase/epimerase